MRAKIICSVVAWMCAATLANCAGAEPGFPGREWPTKSAADAGVDQIKLAEARDYALTGGGSGIVIHTGASVMQWGDPRKRYDLKSTTKSIGITALGLAIADGKLRLADKARDCHAQFGTPPDENVNTGWLDEITLWHLATQTAGFEKPGGYGKLLFEPGSKWLYSDAGPNWIAECVTLAYRRDVNDLMFERVFEPLGITPRDLVWRKNAYRSHEIEGIARREFGSGISANVDSMARIGYLYLRGGKWGEKQIIPREFVEEVRATNPKTVGLEEVDRQQHGNASDHYGLLWWNNADGTLDGVPRDAYWSWGLYDSLIVVIPSLDLVAARAGSSWKRTKAAEHYDILRPFLKPIAAAVRGGRTGNRKTEGPAGGPAQQPSANQSIAPIPPYPASTVIKEVEWAPAGSIVRLAPGSDNWPLTWGKDDCLYTAYGDGRGFQPFVPRKLSLGLARVSGTPPRLKGENLSSATIEQTGDGTAGRKASGMLMVDGVLYLWARNAGNSQLAWSSDDGATWQWADWKFTESFGCPTFLNFGRNYEGARDRFVYVYSPDNDSAYKPADRMVMSRVPTDQIRQREYYDFFGGLDPEGRPVWTKDIAGRQAVFAHPANCYRSSISYNAPLKRYLWCQTLPKGDARFEGGFGIYDAPEPWGPWTTAYSTARWDVGPGETASIPTKWIGRDGRKFWLVFSGEDQFSLRQGQLIVTK